MRTQVKNCGSIAVEENGLQFDCDSRYNNAIQLQLHKLFRWAIGFSRGVPVFRSDKEAKQVGA